MVFFFCLKFWVCWVLTMYLPHALDSKLEQILQPGFFAASEAWKGKSIQKLHGWEKFWSRSLIEAQRLGSLPWVSKSLDRCISSQVTGNTVLFNLIPTSRYMVEAGQGLGLCNNWHRWMPARWHYSKRVLLPKTQHLCPLQILKTAENLSLSTIIVQLTFLHTCSSVPCPWSFVIT